MAFTSESHTVETRRYRTASGSDRMPAFTAHLSLLCFADQTQMNVGSGRYRSRFYNNSRAFTGSALANRALFGSSQIAS